MNIKQLKDTLDILGNLIGEDTNIGMVIKTEDGLTISKENVRFVITTSDNELVIMCATNDISKAVKRNTKGITFGELIANWGYGENR